MRSFSRYRRRNTRSTRASRAKSVRCANLDRTTILSKSRRSNAFLGRFSMCATHTPENTETQIFACLSIALRAGGMARHSAICRAIPRNFHSATGAEPAKFCGCVKQGRFSHFREGSHTRANFQMRSMGIYGVFRKSASVSAQS